MNRYVSRGVRMVDTCAGPYDFCVVESGVEETAIAQARQRGARIIRTHDVAETLQALRVAHAIESKPENTQ